MSQEDRAQDEELHQWQLINKPRPPRPVYKPGDPEYGPEFCKNDDCEDILPEARRRDGQQFCTECKSTQERREKRRY